MPITEAEWQSIYTAISRGQQPSNVVHATVSKRDQNKKQVWLKEYGSDPVEFASWDYIFRIYDDEDDAWREIEVEVQLPDKGDTVLVAKPYGTRGLARVVAPVQLSTSGKKSPSRKTYTKVMQSFEPGQLVYDAGVLDHTQSGPVDPYGTGKWLYCNGAAISRASFKHLFKRVGTEHGNGDGSTTFNIPDFRDGRVPLPRGVNFADVGAIGGASTVALVTANLPSHAHSFSVGDHVHGMPTHQHQVGGGLQFATNSLQSGVSPGSGLTVYHGLDAITDVGGSGGNTFSAGAAAGNTGNAGSGTAHDNMPPYRIVGGMLIRTRR